MSQPISSIMQDCVTSVGMDATVAEVASLLKSRHISSAPVLDGGGVILGIVTSSDAMTLQVRGRDPNNTSAWEICSYRPIEVPPDMPIPEVARLMLTHQIHHVVVMDNASLKGIVSSLDFVKLFSEQNKP